jgi:hypothetical protein
MFGAVPTTTPAGPEAIQIGGEVRIASSSADYSA